VEDHRSEGPGENGVPVPRDLPDQQAHDGEDPWEVGAGHAEGDTVDTTEAAESREAGESAKPGESGEAVPGTDEHPVPDEPSA
jgi:hypothetical protein